MAVATAVPLGVLGVLAVPAFGVVVGQEDAGGAELAVPPAAHEVAPHLDELAREAHDADVAPAPAEDPALEDAVGPVRDLLLAAGEGVPARVVRRGARSALLAHVAAHELPDAGARLIVVVAEAVRAVLAQLDLPAAVVAGRHRGLAIDAAEVPALRAARAGLLAVVRAEAAVAARAPLHEAAAAPGVLRRALAGALVAVPRPRSVRRRRVELADALPAEDARLRSPAAIARASSPLALVTVQGAPAAAGAGAAGLDVFRAEARAAALALLHVALALLRMARPAVVLAAGMTTNGALIVGGPVIDADSLTAEAAALGLAVAAHRETKELGSLSARHGRSQGRRDQSEE
mmetsp:Transcript_96026/g.271520  ORF Transcript_96026/g.271520 Transcript_96026/m.271520 type:complete len:348 (+) Transcript_96026:408-1451(+)